MTTPEDPAPSDATRAEPTVAAPRRRLSRRARTPLGVGVIVAILTVLFCAVPAAVLGGVVGAEFAGHHGGERGQHGERGDRGERGHGRDNGRGDQRDSDDDGDRGGAPAPAPSAPATPPAPPTTPAAPTPSPTS